MRTRIQSVGTENNTPSGPSSQLLTSTKISKTKKAVGGRWVAGTGVQDGTGLDGIYGVGGWGGLAGSLSSLVDGKSLFDIAISEVNALAIKALDQSLALQKTNKQN